jgi:hypothetical protein
MTPFPQRNPVLVLGWFSVGSPLRLPKNQRDVPHRAGVEPRQHPVVLATRQDVKMNAKSAR